MSVFGGSAHTLADGEDSLGSAHLDGSEQRGEPLDRCAVLCRRSTLLLCLRLAVIPRLPVGDAGYQCSVYCMCSMADHSVHRLSLLHIGPLSDEME